MTRARDPAMILVVEDEMDLRRDIVEELQEAGYRTLAAQDGEEALTMLADATPDLLLCDITMPGLDGYGVLKAMRSLRRDLSTVPFVFLTALSEPYEVVKGKRQGADDYLVKPIDYDLMLATIAARLRQVDLIRSNHADEIATVRSALAGLSGGGAEAALDLIALGAVLLDEHAKPSLVNRAARHIAGDADFIDLGAHGIQAPDPVSNRALQQAITEALEAASCGRENVTGVTLHSTHSAKSISAVVCALAQSGGNCAGRPHVALFITAPDQNRRISEPLLMDLFGLTPTEARVASALARCIRTADVAQELGVTQTTIAFHMRNLFQKTGTNRQADLIALVLAGPMMIQSD